MYIHIHTYILFRGSPTVSPCLILSPGGTEGRSLRGRGATAAWPWFSTPASLIYIYIHIHIYIYIYIYSNISGGTRAGSSINLALYCLWVVRLSDEACPSPRLARICTTGRSLPGSSVLLGCITSQLCNMHYVEYSYTRRTRWSGCNAEISPFSRCQDWYVSVYK